MAQAVGRESIKVSDCLPYLKCFNVEDIVNIRGHFSSQKYLRDTTDNKQQIMKEKATAKINERQMDVAKTGWLSCFFDMPGCKRVFKYFYQHIFLWVITRETTKIVAACVNTNGFPQTLVRQKKKKNQKQWKHKNNTIRHQINLFWYTLPLMICIICVEKHSTIKVYIT